MAIIRQHQALGGVFPNQGNNQFLSLSNAKNIVIRKGTLMTIGANLTDRGYLTASYGSVNPDSVHGSFIYGLVVDAGNNIALSFGAAGNEQIDTYTTLRLHVGDFPNQNIAMVWSAGNTQYEGVAAPLNAWLDVRLGQTIQVYADPVS